MVYLYVRKFGFILVRGVMGLFSALPLRAHRALGGFLAWILRDLMHYRRDVVLTNLSRSFPAMPYKEVSRNADRFYRHLGNVIAEAVWIGHSSAERVTRSHIVECANPEVLNAAFENAPGVMLMMTHRGNWELLGGLYCTNYGPEPWAFRPEDVCCVYRRLKSPLWDRVMAVNRMYPLRKTAFDGYVESEKMLRYALEHRRERKIFIFPNDQFPYAIAQRMKVDDFMHQPTWSMAGGAALAVKLGLSVVYMGSRMRPDGGYETVYTEICRDASRMTPEAVMNGYYKLLQEELEAEPWNYLWSHNRWKTV